MSTNTRSFKKAIKNIAEEYKWDPRRIAIAVDESEIREIIDDAKNASTCTNKRFAERKMNESRAIQKVLEIMQESGIKIVKIIDK
jgi:ribosomal protein S25